MHMTRLIDDILTLSKLGELTAYAYGLVSLLSIYSLDNECFVATPVACCPVDFIAETFSIFKTELLAKDISANLDIRPSLAACGVEYVLTDPSRINQLLINLMTNAIKVS